MNMRQRGARRGRAREARGLGALVLLNDEIHAAREVTKTSTGRLQTFRTRGFRRASAMPMATRSPGTAARCAAWRRIPSSTCAASMRCRASTSPIRYAGADGAAIEAFVAAGAKGIVAAGFAPGFVTPAMAAGAGRRR